MDTLRLIDYYLLLCDVMCNKSNTILLFLFFSLKLSDTTTAGLRTFDICLNFVGEWNRRQKTIHVFQDNCKSGDRWRHVERIATIILLFVSTTMLLLLYTYHNNNNRQRNRRRDHHHHHQQQQTTKTSPDAQQAFCFSSKHSSCHTSSTTHTTDGWQTRELTQQPEKKKKWIKAAALKLQSKLKKQIHDGCGCGCCQDHRW